MVSQLITSATVTFLALFPITQPLGAISIFYSLTANETSRLRRLQAKWVAINATAILIFFFLTGRVILELFGISLGVLQMAGGLLVAHTAWRMIVQPPPNNISEPQVRSSPPNISLFPMAIPLISGPGAIGLVIALATSNQQWQSYLGSLLGIAILGIILYLSLRFGSFLVKFIGDSGADALNRILSFFILAIGIQLLSDGFFSLIESSGLI